MTRTAFTPYRLGNISLENRFTMAPMARHRAINNIPNDLMAAYYKQRASAGLIITEGVSPSSNGLGYPRMPGIYTNDQVNAWKKVTYGVREAGGKIFMQLMHTGRIAHALNLPRGAKVVAPSAVGAAGQIMTDQKGPQAHTVPYAMTAIEVQQTKYEYVRAAQNAIDAGFDGVELHAAGGYLPEQFLSPHTNQRTDLYGGNIENRSRFLLELTQEISDAIGADKVGVRLSPHGTENDMAPYAEVDETYTYLAARLNDLNIGYLHLANVDITPAGGPLPVWRMIREQFKGTLILAGGYTVFQAEEDLASGFADLVAFGKPFISNPDLVPRLRKKLPLNIMVDARTLYTPGAKGLIDYPVFDQELVNA
ncbi:alkene reductase [Fulvivirgaceae bacterium PWU5]|uniref:Alkene reductase n=1 Tax=Dawidia cretensis TaxID=2782350 RepID=A0AAP2DWG3_9BACT|nr:alkene reductase [Dawidia cretensis]MBT1708661.1 alkene reductase [Dawidia cretensis]